VVRPPAKISCNHRIDFPITGFKLQGILLARLFQLVETNQIEAPLFDPAVTDPSMTNQKYLRQFCADLLTNAFPHVLPCVLQKSPSHALESTELLSYHSVQIQNTVLKLCDSCNDITKFKLVLRDFLIQLKEFSGDDNAELYLEEKEAEAQRKAEAEREMAMKVPGMLKPSQLEDEEL
jgi:exportin-1